MKRASSAVLCAAAALGLGFGALTVQAQTLRWASQGDLQTLDPYSRNESLTNAMKHGGRGAVVDIFQNWQPDGLQLQVRCRSGHEGPHPGSLVGGNTAHYTVKTADSVLTLNTTGTRAQ